MEARVIQRTLRNQMNRVPQATHRAWVLPVLRFCSCLNWDELSCHPRFFKGRAQTLVEQWMLLPELTLESVSHDPRWEKTKKGVVVVLEMLYW